MNARDIASLIHLAGFATGAVLYAMLGVMTRRRMSNVVAADDGSNADRLPLVAAILGVAWNVGAMIVFAMRDFGQSSAPWVAVLAYTSLGFLPAVVVHSTLRRGKRTEHRWLVAVAYGASSAAAVLHAVAATRGDVLSRPGLLLLTVAYVTVLGALAITEWRDPSFQRTITAVALAAFAISALHLSRHVVGVDQGSWWVELIGHHASLPLVLAILYQDYRFAFTDLFLKRALALLILVALVSLGYASLSPLIDPHAIAQRRLEGTGSHLLATGALLTLWIGTAIAYPWIQRRSYRFIDRVVLRRIDYRDLRHELAQRLSLVADADKALDLACAFLGRGLEPATATWNSVDGPRLGTGTAISLNAGRTAASIIVPTAVGPSYALRVAELSAGRTLLSDDLMLIDAVAASVGRRIDELWLERERAARERQDEELRRLATESELKALRAQLNPHFLFNALNTLGHLMQTSPDRGVSTLYRLTGLLRAILRKTDGQFVTLGDDIEIVESYLAIERERFGERLAVVIDIAPDVRQMRVPPLLVQPLVENAVKHGISPLRVGGTVTVRAFLEEGRLHLSVADTGQGFEPQVETTRGVGLSNIESRLHHYFGELAELSIDSALGAGTTVTIRLPAAGTPALATTA